jgi:hypothetical protein
MVWVADRNQTAPARAAPIPTSSQAEKPRSRSQPGAVKIPLSSPGSISMYSSSAPGRLPRAPQPPS